MSLGTEKENTTLFCPHFSPSAHDYWAKKRSYSPIVIHRERKSYLQMEYYFFQSGLFFFFLIRFSKDCLPYKYSYPTYFSLFYFSLLAFVLIKVEVIQHRSWEAYLRLIFTTYSPPWSRDWLYMLFMPCAIGWWGHLTWSVIGGWD